MASFSFKRSLFGYNRAAVDDAVSTTADELNEARLEGAKAQSALTEVRGELDYTRFSLVEARKESDARADRIRELEAVVAWLADRVVDRERELRAARGESARDTDAPVSDAEAVEATALPSPDPLLTDFPAARRSAVDSAVQAAGERHSAANGSAPAETSSAGPAAQAPGAESSADAEEASANSGEGGNLWTGQVALEVGPLSDFSQLAGLEDAAGGIEGASDISVRRFSKGRATIQLSLEHPVDLLRELESRSSLTFEVRDTRAGRLVLDVAA